MKMFKFHQRARAEYLHTIHYLKPLSARVGLRFQREFRQALDLIRRFSEAGRVTGSHGVRRILLRRIEYAILYLFENDLILIVAVSDLRRQPKYWLDRLDPVVD